MRFTTPAMSDRVLLRGAYRAAAPKPPAAAAATAPRADDPIEVMEMSASDDDDPPAVPAERTTTHTNPLGAYDGDGTDTIPGVVTEPIPGHAEPRAVPPFRPLAEAAAAVGTPAPRHAAVAAAAAGGGGASGSLGWGGAAAAAAGCPGPARRPFEAATETAAAAAALAIIRGGGAASAAAGGEEGLQTSPNRGGGVARRPLVAIGNILAGAAVAPKPRGKRPAAKRGATAAPAAAVAASPSAAWGTPFAVSARVGQKRGAAGGGVKPRKEARLPEGAADEMSV